tara:strand:- start:15 stop:1379 length:1365 start_codon:yes stop_codon:yes gene_type:complete
MLEQLLLAGMNVVRINASHGDHETHKQTIANIRKLDEELGSNTSILVDLQGPKLRIGELEEDEINLEEGAELRIKVGAEKGSAGVVYTNYESFAKDVKPGESVLLDDGKLKVEVISTDSDSEVVCKVIYGGILKPRKGINLPDTEISLPCITEKDEKDLAFALKHNVDWIGLSFVRNPNDIEQLRQRIDAEEKHARIIAKIEKPEAVEMLDEIIERTDAVMIARGDLGVEIPMEEVPLLQREIIDKCRSASRPVIVATQMMESMIESSTPTRAEVNDVATAVLDGTDAVMLSAETSVGKYPIHAVKAMCQIIKNMEANNDRAFNERPPYNPDDNRFITDSICYNACRLARRTKAAAIVTMTYSGYTALHVSSQRPKAHIFMFTSNKQVLSQMSLVWGVEAIYYSKMVSTDHTIADIKYILFKDGKVKDKDFVVHMASMPIKDAGMTNMLKLSRV